MALMDNLDSTAWGTSTSVLPQDVHTELHPPHQPRPPHPLLYFLSQSSSQVDLSRGQVYTFVVHSHSFPWSHLHPPCPASHPAPHRLPAVTSWGILPTLLQQDPWPVPAGAVRYWTLPTPQALGPQTHAPVLHFLAGFP